MSVYLYDDAIIADLRRIFNNPDIYITPADNVFRTLANAKNDKIKFPLISLERVNWSLLDSSHAMKFSGIGIEYDEANNKVAAMKAMPIRINYLLDIWTKHREENDDIMREIIWYYSTHPTLKVEIPYSLNIQHNFNIRFDPDITDNSDIVEHKNRGEYFRQSISLYIDDAYLWKGTKDHPSYIGSLYYEAYSSDEFIDSEKVLPREEERGDNS